MLQTRVILILLLLSVSYYVHTAASSLGRNRTACLEYVNELRRQVAEWYGVADMNRLVYDEEMEMDFGNGLPMCPQKTDLASGKHFVMVKYERNERRHMQWLTIPAQTKLACIEGECGDKRHVTVLVLDKPKNTEKVVVGTKCASGEHANGLCIVKEPKPRAARSFFSSFWR
ncbi:unnamed protein product [Caenorhabditis sp. 36 PRJEB53466]|nr:unnamed protein product [Caenorhabditis sp. 36 PRJEB53466]